MKQILLITDGCSNVGASPVLAAAHALQDGIVVNVVGVLDYGTIGELGGLEIQEIAKAGGGIHRIVGTPQLAQTIQMMTRKTVVQTIQQAVNKEIQHILGAGRWRSFRRTSVRRSWKWWMSWLRHHHCRSRC